MKIVTGYDHFNQKPLYQVVRISLDNDYIGEWTDSIKEAEEEKRELDKKDLK